MKKNNQPPKGRKPQNQAANPFVAKGGIDLTFLVLVLLLLAFGLVMMFSASHAYAFYYENNSYYYIGRQLVFAVMGLAAMFALSFFDYHWFHKLAWPVMGVCIVLLIVVLFMPARNYVHRWIDLGFTTFQPSEIAKFGVVLLFAHIVSINYSKMKDPKYGILPFAIVLAVISGLLLLEPHLSATVLVCTIGLIIMFVGGTDLKWFGIAGAALTAGVVGAALIPGVVSYATSRVAYWIDPFSDATGKGFQTLQSLYAIGSGGLLGVGIGNSLQKYLYIPEPQNDFVFSIVCEELGFVGAVLIIILFALLIWRGFVVAAKSRDRFGAILAVGLVAQVGLQAILNIAVVTNTVPNTGISLPFFSSGGTSLFMLLAQMGVVLSISRQAVLEKE